MLPKSLQPISAGIQEGRQISRARKLIDEEDGVDHYREFDRQDYGYQAA